MPRIDFEHGVSMSVYGDVHVALKSDNETQVDMHDCQVVRITPRGRFTLDALGKMRIASIYQDDQVGNVWARDPEMPRGQENPVPVVNIPPRARLRVIMPLAD
jgi:hypothetical protein